MKVFIVVFLDNLICKLRLYNITCTCIGYNVYVVGNNSFVLKFPFVIINYVKLIRVPLVLAVSHTLPRKVSASSSYANTIRYVAIYLVCLPLVGVGRRFPLFFTNTFKRHFLNASNDY